MNSLLRSIKLGDSRAVRVLPGEVGALFVRRLYEATARSLPARDQEYFRMVSALCHRANDAAQHNRPDEAGDWISLASEMASYLAGEAKFSACDFIKSNESYVCYARQDYAAALQCLDDATIAHANYTASNANSAVEVDPTYSIRQSLQRLHYLHLGSRIHLAAGNFQAAIDCLTTATMTANALAANNGNPEATELLNFMCSRIAGELAISAWYAKTPGEYFSATAGVIETAKEGSFVEYLFFRRALIALQENNDVREMVEFTELGRMKTVCWYAATLALGPLMPPAERKALVILAATWRDMPAGLRSRMLALIDWGSTEKQQPTRAPSANYKP